MKSEDQAWESLRRQASAQLSLGFADRVMRAASVRPGPSPSGQFLLSVATAAVCLLAVMLYQATSARAQADKSMADWTEVASGAEDSVAMQ